MSGKAFLCGELSLHPNRTEVPPVTNPHTGFLIFKRNDVFTLNVRGAGSTPPAIYTPLTCVKSNSSNTSTVIKLFQMSYSLLICIVRDADEKKRGRECPTRLQLPATLGLIPP